MSELSDTDRLPAQSPATPTLQAPGAPSHSLPGLPADWPQQATRQVVSLVDNVRTKTAGPAIRISRAIVYGLVAVILLLVALPLFLVGVTRFLNWAVPGDIAYVYFIVGAVLCAGGLVLWSRRPKGAARAA